MRIILQNYGKKIDKDNLENATDLDEEVAFDDEPFDVPGWVGIYVGGTEVAEVHVRDLYPAAQAMYSKYLQNKEKID